MFRSLKNRIKFKVYWSGGATVNMKSALLKDMFFLYNIDMKVPFQKHKNKANIVISR